jgi:predicted transcriptional regulator
MTDEKTLTPTFAELREQAIALRRQGKSRREIKEILRVGSNQTLNDLLHGEPPLPSTWRPNAKDALHARARELRDRGMSYDQIAAELAVAKSTVSAWVHDMPRPERLSYEECARRQTAAVDAYWGAERARRERAREVVRAGAQETIGPLTNREVLIAGAVSYWCEGTKSKPYRRSNGVNFINSDPRLIKFYLAFLRTAGVTRDQLAFTVSIHESANLADATKFWLEVTDAEPGQFRAPNLKRHNPRTVRLSTGDDYHGCLRVDVLRSGPLYKQIEGWCDAVLKYAEPSTDSGSPS